MPTYHYRCAACGNSFDAVQRFSDNPLTDCPACGGQVRRVIQPVGVVFKGSGWYINDSRKGGANTESNGTSEKSESKPAKADAPKAEAPKPAAAAAD